MLLIEVIDTLEMVVLSPLHKNSLRKLCHVVQLANDENFLKK